MTQCFTQFKATYVESSYNCECIAAYKDKLFVGTKQGSILVYSITYNLLNILQSRPETYEKKVSSEFCFMIRDFNKKPIYQISVIEEFGIFIVLADGKIFVYRLNDYRALHVIEILKGVQRFCYDVYEPNQTAPIDKKKTTSEMMLQDKVDDSMLSKSIINESTFRDNLQLRLCIACSKNKLVLYHWNNIMNKMDHKIDFRIPDTPKCIQLFFDNIFVGTKSEYFLLNIESSNIKSLTYVGKNQESFAFRMSDFMGIKIDENVEFVDRHGNFLHNGTLKWSLNPSQIIYHPPFVMAILHKYIEVRMAAPTMLIQTLNVENASFICRYRDRIYVLLENNQICCLVGTPRQQLVQFYSKNEDFELALMLAKTAQLVGEKEIISSKINTNYAKSLYRNRQFEKAFNIFMDMTIDPFDVLNLYPDLRPDRINQGVKMKQINADFSKEENIEATHALINYLVKWRHKLRKKPPTTNQTGDKESLDVVLCYSMNDGTERNKPKKQLLEIVDTSLLKCYLIVKSPLVAPLLRQDNYCHEEETKKWLYKYEKYQELILLFENKMKHSDALSLLHSQAAKSHSPLKGLSPIVQYLKNLNPQYLDLVYQFGDVVLEKRPREWMSIFSHWDHRMKQEKTKIPRYKDRLVKHLQNKASQIVLSFIERTIYQLTDDGLSDDFEDEEEDEDGEDQIEIKGLNDIKGQRKLLQNINQIKLCGNKNKIALVDLSKFPEMPLKETDDGFSRVTLHTIYAEELIKQILKTRKTELLCIKIADEQKSPAPDALYVYELRSRLKQFLESPKALYMPESIMNEFPYDGLYEERAAILARDGKHEQALTLWIHLFKNWKQAELHCEQVYPKNPDIYLTLLKICVEPSEPSAIGIVLPPSDSLEMSFILNNDDYDMVDTIVDGNITRQTSGNKRSISELKFQSQIYRAVEILNKYRNKLPVVSTLQMVSECLTVKDLIGFVQNALRNQSSLLNHTLFIRNIQFYHKMNSNLRSCDSARSYFMINEETVCNVCHKVMGASAVARYPDGSLVHYGCCRHLPNYKMNDF